MGNVGLKQRARLQALEKAWEDTQRDFFDRLDMVDDFDALALSEEISWLGAKPRTSEEYEKRMGPLRVRIERALRHFERD
jgi:hypothetical protein